MPPRTLAAAIRLPVICPGACITQKLPLPKKSIAFAKGPNAVQGPSSSRHFLRPSSSSKILPSHWLAGSLRCPGWHSANVPGPKWAVARGKSFQKGRQWSQCAWLRGQLQLAGRRKNSPENYRLEVVFGNTIALLYLLRDGVGRRARGEFSQ